MKLRVFTADDVRRSISMPRAIELMREAFAALSVGQVDCPIRTILTNERGTVLYKPAWSAAAGIFCVKVVSVFPDNAGTENPVTPGIIVVNDGQTGMPIAMMDAGYLTALRTGAATGLATDLLARPDASIGAMFGTGGQARHQLEAMLAVRELTTVFVFSRRPENAAAFCSRVGEQFPNTQLVAQPKSDALAEADVVTTCTTSPTPLFDDAALKRDVHVNAVGSLGPTRSEIPPETVLRAQVVVDQREAGLKEAGELRPLFEDGRLSADFSPPELGELVSSTRSVDAIATVFKSAGNAVQDLVCAAEVLRVADSSFSGATVTL